MANLTDIIHPTGLVGTGDDVTLGAVTVTSIAGDGSGLTNLPSTAPTTSDVLSATSGASLGAVGTYAFLRTNSGSTSGVTAGSTYAGSSLRYYAGVDGGSNTNTYTYSYGSAPSGTWKAMGTGSDSRYSHWQHTLFLRIS